MINTKKFEDKYNELILVVENEIKMVDKGVSKRSSQQLKTIVHDMDKMNEFRDAKLYAPSFPRFIVDSWDYNDSLGIELLKLFEMYKRMKS